MSNWLFRGTFPDALEWALGPITTGTKCFFVSNSGKLPNIGAGHHPHGPTLGFLRIGKPASPQPVPFLPTAPGSGAHGSRGLRSFGSGSVPGEPEEAERQEH